ncbi:MAG: tRNA (adenosine(37)-N6)-dimethylallyltransferase MiaA [Clostridia bacterium]|nr:tRNA (adenosine(37)-N6)-dimethylallyltransferase MiaA [Clostridia bacterium]
MMKKVIVVCGPTASGKTALAIGLAKKLNTEIVSADALLVYKGLNIGTAKPTEEEKEGVVHHLIDVVEPTEAFSVSDYERMALPIVERLLEEGKTPILCGGTGFYIQSLLYKSGFGNAPANDEVREKYERMAKEDGVQAVHDKLKSVDPESAEILHPNDLKRVIRALEIFETTGKKKSDQCDERVPRFPFEAFCIDFPREELYRRIDLRVDRMMQAGLIDEVKELLKSIPKTAQCMQGIGYKEIVEGMEEGLSLDSMSDIIKRRTRNYAKRQQTFFKRMEHMHYLEPNGSQIDEVLRILCQT